MDSDNSLGPYHAKLGDRRGTLILCGIAPPVACKSRPSVAVISAAFSTCVKNGTSVGVCERPLKRHHRATPRKLGRRLARQTAKAMKGGAIEFLTKPFREQDLLEAVRLGLDRDRVRRDAEEALRALKERFETLSPREREILIEVARGRLSKQIAGDIGISETTVKVHRSNLMRKLKLRSLTELARIADKLKLRATEAVITAPTVLNKLPPVP